MTLLSRAETVVVHAALRLLRALPPDKASDLGGAVARGIGTRLPVSRIADINLRLALPELDQAARRRIIRGAWNTLGRTMAELPHLPDLRRTDHGPGWEIEGAEILQAQAARGGPAIFVSGHIGNWEMLPPVLASYGIAMSSVYRAAGNAAVNAILADLRMRAMQTTVPMFPKGAAGARGALKHLSSGGYLGMLMDQKLNDGISAQFFGHPAMTAPSLAALALRFRCPVIPGHIQRIGPARLRLIVEPPLPLPDTGNRQADILSLTQTVNDKLEQWIRAWPEGWLWLHRRWPKNLYQ